MTLLEGISLGSSSDLWGSLSMVLFVSCSDPTSLGRRAVVELWINYPTVPSIPTNKSLLPSAGWLLSILHWSNLCFGRSNQIRPMVERWWTLDLSINARPEGFTGTSQIEMSYPAAWNTESVCYRNLQAWALEPEHFLVLPPRNCVILNPVLN